MENGIVYRLLPFEEWERLKPIFEMNDAKFPDPQIATASVAERDGSIVGMLVLQAALHTEPLWIADEERGKVSWKRLLGVLDELFQNGACYYVFAPDEKVEKMAELAGLKKLTWSVWVKEI